MLEDNQLLTIIKEAEAVTNTRSLTYVGSNVEHILKPADFLTPGKCLSIEVLMEGLPLRITYQTITYRRLEPWQQDNG